MTSLVRTLSALTFLSLASVGVASAAPPMSAGPAASPAQAAPNKAQQIQAEIMQIDEQLRPAQEKALSTPELKKEETKIRELLISTMTEIEPKMPEHQARLEALSAEINKAGDDQAARGALMQEGQQLSAKLQQVQIQAFEKPKVKTRVERFESMLNDQMRKDDPKNGELIERRTALIEKLRTEVDG